MSIKRDTLVGFLITIFSLLLIFYLIPNYIDSPSSVRKIVLSPVFWPVVIGWLMLIIGAGIIVAQYLNRNSRELIENTNIYDDMPSKSYGRVIIFTVFMIVYYLLIPVIGMVWSSCLAFIVFSILIAGTEHRKTAVIVGLLLPLALYVFFNHVAGVNIPQTELLRLP